MRIPSHFLVAFALLLGSVSCTEGAAPSPAAEPEVQLAQARQQIETTRAEAPAVQEPVEARAAALEPMGTQQDMGTEAAVTRAQGCPIGAEYNDCVIRELAEAESARALMMMIEAHRALQNDEEKTATIRRFVENYPNHPRHMRYQRELDR